MGALPRYVVITPVRDEEAYLRFTVESIVRQTVHPVEYILVNDGSTDKTGDIIDEYARRHSWIRAVHRKDRGFRKYGGGIIEAFYAGYTSLTCTDWDFLCKLDGDLSFEPDYFEKCLERFQQIPELGIGGGTLYYIENGVKRLEDCPAFHVRGGVKLFRRACWEAVGGLWEGPGTDTIDEVKANMLGWRTMSFAGLEMQHHRPTGATLGRVGSLVKDGRTHYVLRYHPLFLLAKCAVRSRHYPYVIGSLALLYGYLRAFLKRIPRFDDDAVVAYLRRQQFARLCGRESIWR